MYRLYKFQEDQASEKRHRLQNLEANSAIFLPEEQNGLLSVLDEEGRSH